MLALAYSFNWGACLLAPLVAALLMKDLLSLPFILGIILMLYRYLLIYLLPETSPNTRYFGRSNDNAGNSSQDIGTLSNRIGSDGATSTSERLAFSSKAMKGLRSISSDLHHLIREPQIIFCFLCFFTKRVAFASESFMLQYTGELLNIKLHQTAWLRTVQAVGSVIVTGLALPLVVRLLLRKKVVPVRIYTNAVRASLIVLIIGFIGFWIAKKPAELGLGMFLDSVINRANAS